VELLAARLSEQRVQVVEKLRAPLQAFLIRDVGLGQAVDQGRNTAGFRPRELAVLEVDVVHDLADDGEGRIVKSALLEKDLERAPVAFVGELRLEHIEA